MKKTTVIQISLLLLYSLAFGTGRIAELRKNLLHPMG